MDGPAPTRLLVLEFLLSNHGVENTLFQPHPFPIGPTGDVLRWHDLIQHSARSGIDHLAGPIVSVVQDLRCGDHRVSMHHDPRGYVSLPEDGPVVAVEGHQLAQKGFFSLMKGHVAEGLEHASRGGHGDLGQGRIVRFGQELCQIGCLADSIEGLRVVVRTVVGMAPVVYSRRKGFRPYLIADQGLALGPHDPQRFGAGDLGGAIDGNQGIRQIIRQMHARQVALFDPDASPQKTGGVHAPAQLRHLLRVLQLDVELQFGVSSQTRGDLTRHIAQNHTDTT